MSIYYTYLVKCLPTNEYYYGVRYAKNANPDDLWKTYFTSSKIVKDRIEKYGIESFLIQIRKTFDTPEAARKWEYKVITKMNMINRLDFMNKSNGVLFSKRVPRDNCISIKLIETGKYVFVPLNKATKLIKEGKAIKKGSPKSQYTKDKISKSLLGKKKTKEHIKNIVASQKGIKKKTWEEQCGEEGAKLRRQYISNKLSGRTTKFKGKKYEEILGKEKSIKMKRDKSIKFTQNNPGKKMKGKTYEELYGKEKADDLKKLRSKIGLSNRKFYKIFYQGNLVYEGNRENIPKVCQSLTGKKLSNILYNKTTQEKYNITIVII